MPTGRSNSRATVPYAGQRQQPVAVHTRVPPRASASRALQSRQYGDIIDSDEVHPEIEALGKAARRVIQENLQATTEAQVIMGVKRFGPSKASRKILNKENEAAKLAMETGLYVVWRLMEAPALSGATNDFCARIGYAHHCFCQHTLAAHARPAKSGRGAKAGAMHCEVDGCGCPCFRYIPNTPEEIGEGWLSRRAQWDPTQWSPKCRCGHGSKVHEPSRRAPCRSCGCAGYISQFLCVVCDRPMEAHETVVESEAVRQAAGLPVREAFFPLAGIDWDVRECVLDDPTGGGVLSPPVQRAAIGAKTDTHALPSTATPLPMDVVPYCHHCGTVFRSVTSKFCHKCGQARSLA